MYVHVCVRIYVHSSTRASVRVHAHTYGCVRARVCTHRFACVRESSRACVFVLCPYICVCVHTHVCASMRARTSVCLCLCIHMCISTCLRTHSVCVHMCTHTRGGVQRLKRPRLSLLTPCSLLHRFVLFGGVRGSAPPANSRGRWAGGPARGPPGAPGPAAGRALAAPPCRCGGNEQER